MLVVPAVVIVVPTDVLVAIIVVLVVVEELHSPQSQKWQCGTIVLVGMVVNIVVGTVSIVVLVVGTVDVCLKVPGTVDVVDTDVVVGTTHPFKK